MSKLDCLDKIVEGDSVVFTGVVIDTNTSQIFGIKHQVQVISKIHRGFDDCAFYLDYQSGYSNNIFYLKTLDNLKIFKAR